jgi:1,4-alpha-glucan branching enzyme
MQRLNDARVKVKVRLRAGGMGDGGRSPMNTDPHINIKKIYLKTRKVCKVCFQLPRQAANGAGHVSLVGDFNEWNQMSHPMRRLKDGTFSVTLDLEPGREYQYRFLIDGSIWENDWHADKYVANPFGSGDNSVVIV